MASRPHVSPLGVVLVLGAGCLSPSVVEAAFVTTAAAAFSSSASLTDTETGGATNSANVSLGSSSLAQFNSALGVLTGATLNLTSIRKQTVTVSATSSDGNNNQQRETNGTGSSSAALSAPGVTSTFATISHQGSCEGPRLAGCGPSEFVASAGTNASLSIPAGSLDDYVGNGNVAVTRTAPSLSAYQKDNKFPGAEATTYDVEWAGTLTASYDYLLHAAPLFDDATEMLQLNLSFGDVFLNDPASLSFAILNLFDDDRVGLDLDGIAEVAGGDSFKFTLTGVSSFTGLAPGDSQDYFATLDTSTVGTFAASYIFSLSDADVGAAASRHTYELTLNLFGSVVSPATTRQVEPRNNVPEPATLALFTLGIATLPLVRRRRTPS